MHQCLCEYKICVEAPWEPEEDPVSSEAGIVVVIGELPNAGAGNSTWVLYKSSRARNHGSDTYTC